MKLSKKFLATPIKESSHNFVTPSELLIPSSKVAQDSYMKFSDMWKDLIAVSYDTSHIVLSSLQKSAEVKTMGDTETHTQAN